VIRFYAPVSGRTSIYGQANLATALGLAGNMAHCRRALDRALRQRDEAAVKLKDATDWLLTARQAAEDTASFQSWVMAATQQVPAQSTSFGLSRAIGSPPHSATCVICEASASQASLANHTGPSLSSAVRCCSLPYGSRATLLA